MGFGQLLLDKPTQVLAIPPRKPPMCQKPLYLHAKLTTKPLCGTHNDISVALSRKSCPNRRKPAWNSFWPNLAKKTALERRWNGAGTALERRWNPKNGAGGPENGAGTALECRWKGTFGHFCFWRGSARFWWDLREAFIGNGIPALCRLILIKSRGVLGEFFGFICWIKGVLGHTYGFICWICVYFEATATEQVMSKYIWHAFEAWFCEIARFGCSWHRTIPKTSAQAASQQYLVCCWVKWSHFEQTCSDSAVLARSIFNMLDALVGIDWQRREYGGLGRSLAWVNQISQFRWLAGTRISTNPDHTCSRTPSMLCLMCFDVLGRCLVSCDLFTFLKCALKETDLVSLETDQAIVGTQWKTVAVWKDLWP